MTRQDLAPGQQATQCVHAAFEFAVQYPITTDDWIRTSQYVAVLSAKTEADLIALKAKADQRGIRGIVVAEPDLDYAVTALAFEPTIESKKLCSNLPLTLKGEIE